MFNFLYFTDERFSFVQPDVGFILMFAWFSEQTIFLCARRGESASNYGKNK